MSSGGASRRQGDCPLPDGGPRDFSATIRPMVGVLRLESARADGAADGQDAVCYPGPSSSFTTRN